jgi:excisionase family DNA binding protein
MLTPPGHLGPTFTRLRWIAVALPAAGSGDVAPMNGARIPPDGLPRLLTAQEAAEVLRTTAATVRGMALGGGLPHLRLGRRVLFPLDALNDWINRNTKEPGSATTTKSSEWRGLDYLPPRATVAVGRSRHRRVDQRRKADPAQPLRVIGASGQGTAVRDDASAGGR